MSQINRLRAAIGAFNGILHQITFLRRRLSFRRPGASMEKHLVAVGLGDKTPLFADAVELDYAALSSGAGQDKTATRTQVWCVGADSVADPKAGTAACAGQKSIVVHETKPREWQKSRISDAVLLPVTLTRPAFVGTMPEVAATWPSG